ncbi:hypothetical protein D9615_010646 [Tricholomella constricta]|uniref:Uncharacterized protein n=2 Tax=Tricholomella constricta TaxID=117010 RepID=A0A8H5GKB4_9AGAR|nr:hypothetical protein D9615_010646 [Tricholomella constricta]
MAYDSRSFGTPRLASNAGYEEPPVVDDSITFYLPRIQQLCGSMVNSEYVAWSPNSRQSPFLPGVVPQGWTPIIPRDRTQRRLDGHLGRFDFTVSPQMVSGQVWRGFILLPQAGYRWRKDLPEYDLLTKQWESTGPHVGHVSTEYVTRLRRRLDELEKAMAKFAGLELSYTNYWASRPQLPLRSEIDHLARLSTWEDVVDMGVEIQRNMKDRAAWVAFATRLTSVGWRSVIDDVRKRKEGALPANDNFIGAWINGNREQDSLWLLSQGVPCFIVHRLDPDDRWTARVAHDRRRSWTEGSGVQFLDSEKNPYDFVAIRNGSVRSCFRTPPYPSPEPRASAIHRELSAASKQGWTGESTGVWPFRPQTPRPESPRVDYTAQGDVDMDEPAVPPNPTLDAPPPETVNLYAGRVAWVKPPAVKSAQGKAGKWRKFEGVSETKFVEIGKRNDLETEYCYYDREFRRELRTDYKLSPPAGLTTDTRVFGMPAPTGSYWTVDCQAQVKASRWVYLQLDPKRGDAGREPEPPEESALPKLPFTADQGSTAGTSIPLEVEEERGPLVAIDGLLASAEGSESSLAPSGAKPELLDAAKEAVPPLLAAEIDQFVLSIAARQRDSDEGSLISLGSESSRAPSPMLVDEPHPMNPPTTMRVAEAEAPNPLPPMDPPFLRSSPFPLTTPLDLVEDAVRAAAREMPEVQITSLVGTSTSALRTLWVALATPEGAAALRGSYPLASTPVRARVELLRATEEDFTQASVAAPPTMATGANRELASSSGPPPTCAEASIPGDLTRDPPPPKRDHREQEQRKRGRSPLQRSSPRSRHSYSPHRRMGERAPVKAMSPAGRAGSSRDSRRQAPPIQRRAPSPRPIPSSSKGKQRQMSPSPARSPSPRYVDAITARPLPTLDPAQLAQLTSQAVLDVLTRMGYAAANAPPAALPAPLPPAPAAPIAGPSTRPSLSERLTETSRRIPLESRLSNPVPLQDRFTLPGPSTATDLEDGEVPQMGQHPTERDWRKSHRLGRRERLNKYKGRGKR